MAVSLIVAVVADTHMPRAAKKLPAALLAAFDEHSVERILHAGDFTAPEVTGLFEEIAPLDAVAGNNDPPAILRRFGKKKIVTLGGVKVGLVHGDGAGATMDNARSAFAGSGVDAILFGHSHVPHCERHGAVWYVNPGSPTDKRRQPLYSFAIMKIQDGRVQPSLHLYPNKD